MAAGINYTIDFTDSSLPGKSPFQVKAGEFDSPEMAATDATKSHTSIHLFGQGYLRYGEKVNENFLKTLEHFASPTPPVNPTIGQIWFDSSMNMMKMYDVNQEWASIGGIMPPNYYVIVDANSTTFFIDGNNTKSFPALSEFAVAGGSNAGSYAVVSATYNTATTRTQVVVNTTIPSPGPGGTIVTNPFPTSPVVGRIWFNVADNKLYMWDGDNWVMIFSTNENGDLDMEMVRRIINLPNPVNNQDAATKKYVDDAITNGDFPSQPELDALAAIVAGKVNRSGDTMNGNLILPASLSPANQNQAVTRGYVDQQDSLQVTSLAGKVNRSGDTMSGFLSLHADPAQLTHAATKSYVDSQQAASTAGKVNRSGDTMSGFLSLHADPTQSTHAATKSYVDSQPKTSLTTTLGSAWNNNAAFNMTYNTLKFGTGYSGSSLFSNAWIVVNSTSYRNHPMWINTGQYHNAFSYTSLLYGNTVLEFETVQPTRIMWEGKASVSLTSTSQASSKIGIGWYFTVQKFVGGVWVHQENTSDGSWEVIYDSSNYFMGFRSVGTWSSTPTPGTAYSREISMILPSPVNLPAYYITSGADFPSPTTLTTPFRRQFPALDAYSRYRLVINTFPMCSNGSTTSSALLTLGTSFTFTLIGE